ncbi:MAG: hypothetical protein WDM80_16590 [Limisphaerales bacterium]
MKKIILTISLLSLIAITGCAPMSVVTRTVPVSASVGQADIIEIAITAARQVGFPPATKIDKQTGIVEFGGFGMPELGITAQVRVKSPVELEVTVRRGSVYIPLGADKQADEFVAKLKEGLNGAEVKVVK